MGVRVSQRGAALALVQLLEEQPALREAGWSIGSVIPELRGFVHGGGLAELAAYAEVLGGSVRAGDVYEARGVLLRRHVLTTVWRDVPVEVVVSVPVTVEAVAS